MKKSILAVVLVVGIVVSGLTGCGVKAKFSSLDWLPDDADLVTWSKAGIKAVSWLKTAASYVLPILCVSGKVDQEICDLEVIAAKRAAPVLDAAEKALSEYEANPSTTNKSALEVAKAALMELWGSYNDINGKSPFVDAIGNLLLTTGTTANPQ